MKTTIALVFCFLFASFQCVKIELKGDGQFQGGVPTAGIGVQPAGVFNNNFVGPLGVNPLVGAAPFGVGVSHYPIGARSRVYSNRLWRRRVGLGY